MRGAPRPCWARGAAPRLSLVGFRRRRRGRRGGGLSVRALPGRLVGWVIGRLVGGAFRPVFRWLFRFEGLLWRIRREVGHGSLFTPWGVKGRREVGAQL